jgi:hypothetical protein
VKPYKARPGSASEHAPKEAFKFYTYVNGACNRFGIRVREGSEVLD